MQWKWVCYFGRDIMHRHWLGTSSTGGRGSRSRASQAAVRRQQHTASADRLAGWLAGRNKKPKSNQRLQTALPLVAFGLQWCSTQAAAAAAPQHSPPRATHSHSSNSSESERGGWCDGERDLFLCHLLLPRAPSHRAS